MSWDWRLKGAVLQASRNNEMFSICTNGITAFALNLTELGITRLTSLQRKEGKISREDNS
jgi:hypothetical protein